MLSFQLLFLPVSIELQRKATVRFDYHISYFYTLGKISRLFSSVFQHQLWMSTSYYFLLHYDGVYIIACKRCKRKQLIYAALLTVFASILFSLRQKDDALPQTLPPIQCFHQISYRNVSKHYISFSKRCIMYAVIKEWRMFPETYYGNYDFTCFLWELVSYWKMHLKQAEAFREPDTMMQIVEVQAYICLIKTGILVHFWYTLLRYKRMSFCCWYTLLRYKRMNFWKYFQWEQT